MQLKPSVTVLSPWSDTPSSARMTTLSLAMVASLIALTCNDFARSAPQAPPAAAAPAAAATAPTSAWPQTTQSDGRGYKMYEPQFESLDGSDLKMSAAVEVAISNGSVRRGIALMTAQAVAADVPGEMEVNTINVTDLMFGTADDQQAAQALAKALNGLAFTVDRSTLISDMKLSNATSSTTAGISNTPPTFVYSATAAVLVTIDGTPIQVPAGSDGWMYVHNTPFTVLISPTSAWYVQVGASTWMSSATQSGPFTVATAPPASAIAALGTAPDPQQTLGSTTTSPTATKPAPKATKTPSNVIIATQPTVLIATAGAPALQAAGTGMSEVTNSNVLLLQTTTPSQWWTIAAGRWFRAPALTGPWTFVAPTALPASFQSLPARSTLVAARASVPGTVESMDAVVAAREVRTVTVRADASCPLTYKGNPQFVPVAGLTGHAMQYATNASDPVLQVAAKSKDDGDASGASTYLCCSGGAWFAATTPTGPWAVTDSIPREIYDIPAACPDYSATYVEVYGSTRDPSTNALTSVTFGFSGGYLGTYVNQGAPVFGTGYDYNAASTGAAPTVDTYQAYPSTYDAAVSYDGQTGTYSPPLWNDNYAYASPWIQPQYLTNGWDGWGWCGGWNSGWGWGWNSQGDWNHWSSWWNHFNPYWNPTWQNGWGHDNRMYGAARGDNAVAGYAAHNAVNASDDWNRWNSNGRVGAEPQRWASNATNAGENPAWQRWDDDDRAAAAARATDGNVANGAAGTFNRNTSYGYNSVGASGYHNTMGADGYHNTMGADGYHNTMGADGYHNTMAQDGYKPVSGYAPVNGYTPASGYRQPNGYVAPNGYNGANANARSGVSGYHPSYHSGYSSEAGRSGGASYRGGGRR